MTSRNPTKKPFFGDRSGVPARPLFGGSRGETRKPLFGGKKALTVFTAPNSALFELDEADRDKEA